MPFHQPDSIRYLTFDSLDVPQLTHAVFTRIGGVSPPPWAELNMGLTVGDDEQNVLQNRRLAFQTVGREISSMSDSWLVHGTEAVVYDRPRPAGQEYPPKADIVMTDRPEVTLFMRFADCVPILLYDPVHNAIALAHAGWIGTTKRTAAAAVNKMQRQYGSKPADMLAVIGPSIGPECYPVGDEVVQAVDKSFGNDAAALLPKFEEIPHFDLWTANRLTLEQAGVRQIDAAEMCTSSNTELWYSHRGERGKTGRFAVLMGLNG